MEFCGVWVGVSNGVLGYLGGDDAGVLNIVVVVIFSKNPSNCFSDNALCNVSSGRIGGTPPNPSSTKSFTGMSNYSMNLFELLNSIAFNVSQKVKKS